jgi:hypothetical protein
MGRVLALSPRSWIVPASLMNQASYQEVILRVLDPPCTPYYSVRTAYLSRVHMSYKPCKSNNVLHLSHHSHRIERIHYLTQNPLREYNSPTLCTRY